MNDAEREMLERALSASESALKLAEKNDRHWFQEPFKGGKNRAKELDEWMQAGRAMKSRPICPRT